MTGATPSAPVPAPGGRAASAPLLGRGTEPTVFELSSSGRRSASFRSADLPMWDAAELVPADHLAPEPVPLPEVSERDLVAHHTRLTHRQYSVDLGAYPLGSCTMKYNPKVCDWAAALPGLARVHPASPPSLIQGWLELLVSLGDALAEVTGMHAVSLQPPAGASGELTGLLIMRAYHAGAGTTAGAGATTGAAAGAPRTTAGAAAGARRTKVVIPDSAHGTNPASVALGGYQTVTVPSDERGCVDVGALRAILDEDVAGIMLTNPNTLGLFEEDIAEIAEAVHDVGGLVYYDGANLNAILGVTRPGDMGFDIVHLNLHKTFAVPHGGGGPGAGPVAVTQRLAPFLPGPLPVATADSGYTWHTPSHSIGRVHGWHGNALALARAYTYLVAIGGDGMRRVAEAAVLNANWLRRRLGDHYQIPHDRPCMHECVVSAAELRRAHGVRAVDVAKRLLEEGFHAPTVAFPLVVDEALMIEPTETESPQTLAALADALVAIAEQASADDRRAPRTTPVGRVDEARAARRLVPTFDTREDA